jgi:hypothetical protein
MERETEDSTREGEPKSVRLLYNQLHLVIAWQTDIDTKVHLSPSTIIDDGNKTDHNNDRAISDQSSTLSVVPGDDRKDNAHHSSH